MKSKLTRIWVDESFARMIRVESAKSGKKIKDFTKDLALGDLRGLKDEFERKPKTKSKEERFNYSIFRR